MEITESQFRQRVLSKLRGVRVSDVLRKLEVDLPYIDNQRKKVNFRALLSPRKNKKIDP